jgi:hypothetical protein
MTASMPTSPDNDERAMGRLSRDEMIHLIERLLRGEGGDDEASAWLDALARSIPNPHISDLIFRGEADLTAEQILDRASRYRPFAL